MDITEITASLVGCKCGIEHRADIKAVEIGSGLLACTADILAANGFPRRILAVADRNTLAASEGIIELLERGGFEVKLKVYDNLRSADIIQVCQVEECAHGCEGILSIGTGSLNDICRLAAKRREKAFAIFATAPSMDGFASGSSPITQNGFKQTVAAKQPSIIIGDTKILAASPAILKRAGFGDMIAKYIALVDWRISSLLTGEYYCEALADITREALRRITCLADKITVADEEAAGAVMQALVLTGLAMRFGNTVRPASGAEHMIAHYWEMKKAQQGLLSDFHGRKVGVATLMVAKKYKELQCCEHPSFHADCTDWSKVYSTYGSRFEQDVRRLNSPTVTQGITPELLEDNWQQMRSIIARELPDYDTLLSLMLKAGAPTTPDEIEVSAELAAEGFELHPYLRHRLTLMRLLTMIDN